MWALVQLLIFVLIALVAIAIVAYNSLQVLGQKIKAANSNVITILQKRVDLINKLMDIAKEYGNHEKLVHISVSNNVRDMFSSTNGICIKGPF